MLLSSYPAGTAPTQQARAGANCIKPSEGRTEDTLYLEHQKPDEEVSEITHPLALHMKGFPLICS